MNFRVPAIGCGLALFAIVATAAGAAPAKPETGLLHRSYHFAPADKTLPYEIYVPTTYDGSKAYPLAVYLHGASGDEREIFDRTDATKLAETRGVIVLAPLGYNPFGSYGDIYPVVATKDVGAHGQAIFRKLAADAPPDWAKHQPPHPLGKEGAPATAQESYIDLPAAAISDPQVAQWSEEDTMEVIARVRRDYNIDSTRMYLFGNSMGGVGTQYLAAKYPELWAAIAPAGGPIAAWSYPFSRLRDFHIAVLYVHGELDEHSHWRWSKALADAAKADGADAQLLMVPHGLHGHAWIEALPKVIDFLLSHRKQDGQSTVR